MWQSRKWQLSGVNSFTANICGIYKLHITSYKTGSKKGPKAVASTSLKNTVFCRRHWPMLVNMSDTIVHRGSSPQRRGIISLKTLDILREYSITRLSIRVSNYSYSTSLVQTGLLAWPWRNGLFNATSIKTACEVSYWLVTDLAACLPGCMPLCRTYWLLALSELQLLTISAEKYCRHTSKSSYLYYFTGILKYTTTTIYLFWKCRSCYVSHNYFSWYFFHISPQALT